MNIKGFEYDRCPDCGHDTFLVLNNPPKDDDLVTCPDCGAAIARYREIRMAINGTVSVTRCALPGTILPDELERLIDRRRAARQDLIQGALAGPSDRERG